MCNSPGDPTAIWHLFRNFLSLSTGIPPMKEWTPSPDMWKPIARMTSLICTAISRVGANTRTCHEWNNVWQQPLPQHFYHYFSKNNCLGTLFLKLSNIQVPSLLEIPINDQFETRTLRIERVKKIVLYKVGRMYFLNLGVKGLIDNSDSRMNNFICKNTIYQPELKHYPEWRSLAQ